MGSNLRFSRRGFLQVCGLTGGALAVHHVAQPSSSPSTTPVAHVAHVAPRAVASAVPS
ncbi:MAG: twin-arginine translocation signal domain-containing protein, partial [Myxococcales bacterium]